MLFLLGGGDVIVLSQTRPDRDLGRFSPLSNRKTRVGSLLRMVIEVFAYGLSKNRYFLSITAWLVAEGSCAAIMPTALP